MSLHTGSEHALESPAGWRPEFQPELGARGVSTGQQLQPQGPRVSQEQVMLLRGAGNAACHGGPAFAHGG